MKSSTRTVLCALALALCSVPLCPPRLFADCNANGIDDAEEIASGAAEDCNGNGIPDACELAPFDVSLVGVEFHPLGTTRRPVTADFDGNGFDDVAIGSVLSDDQGSNILVSLGDGDGDFQGQVLAPPGSLVALLVGRFDDDAAPDLAAVFDGEVTVFWNDGSAGFEETTAVPLPAGSGDVVALATGDSGRDDLVVLHDTEPRLEILASNGDRTFSAGGPVALPDTARAVATGDFDSDGVLDLAVTYGSSPNSSLLDGDGNGGFAAARDFDIQLQGTFSLMTSDLDADGDPDLAASNASALTVAPNEAGNLPVSTVYDEGRPNSIAAADLDADSDLELIVGNTFSSALLARRNTALDFSLATQFPTGLNPRGVTTLDFDADGDNDLIALAGEGSNSRVLLIANGNRLFPDALRFSSSTKGTRGLPHSIALADFNNDGLLDVTTPNGSKSTVSVLLANPDASFQNARTYRFSVSVETILQSIAAGDLDADGYADIVAADLRKQLLHVRFNAGDATFHEGDSYASGNGPRMVTTADVTGDGLADLLSANESNSSVSLIAGLGNRMFADKQDIEVQSGPRCVNAVDLDGDGPLDLAVATRNARAFSIHRNTGGGVFAPAVEFPVIGSPNFLEVADFDGDALFDLAVVHSNLVTVFAGDGTLGFAERGTVDTFQTPFSLATGDIDGDGLRDIVTANPNGAAFGSVSLIRGMGDGNLYEPVRYAVGAECRLVEVGDIEGDGDVDIISANRSSENITILRNDTLVIAPFVETICTELEFFDLSVPADTLERPARGLRYFVAATDPAPLPPVVYEDTDGITTAAAFLSREFPEAYAGLTDEGFTDVARVRASRQLFSGQLLELRSPAGRAYGFTIDVEIDDSAELPLVDEARSVYEALRGTLPFEMLGYLPRNDTERDHAASWSEPGFPILGGNVDTVSFRRGDVDASAVVNITDGSLLLNHLFIGGSPIPCAKGADADDSNKLDVSDALYILNFLFLGGPQPAPPFEECGTDPTEDALSCEEFDACP